MGNKQARFKEETIRDLEETTPFNRAEIQHTFRVFSELYDKEPDDVVVVTLLTTEDGFANPECEVSIETIVNHFPQLYCNPFKRQICTTFCTSDNGKMQFVEFLDMVSSFSPKADLEKKIFHAFQIFDFDRDGLISRDDMNKMIDMMTHEEDTDSNTDSNDDQQWSMTQKWLVDGIFTECHKRVSPDDPSTSGGPMMNGRPTLTMSSGAAAADTNSDAMAMNETLTIEDFRYCIYRSPDFVNTFSFNL